MTTVNVNGMTLELAKCTLRTMEKLDEVGKTQALRAKAEKMYALMDSIVDGGIADVVDGDSYETCDLCKLVNVYNAANDGYRADMNRSQTEMLERNMAKVADMSEKVERMTRATDKLKQVRPAN